MSSTGAASLRPHARRLLACALAAAALVAGSASIPERSEAQDSTPSLDRVVASLTVDERIGQLVMVNFVGDDVSDSSDIASLVRDFKVGAVLITASNGNIVNRNDTAGQLAALTNGLQSRAMDATARSDGAVSYGIPLFIATDNEGDLYPFTNVTHNYTQIPNNMTIGATFDTAQAKAVGDVVGRELSAAGVNLLLGPVVDVLDNPRSGGAGDIGVRSFGGSPAWVGSLARAYVSGVHEGSGGRMLTVAKHFPGHGGSDRATDDEVPAVNKTLDQLRATDLAPFAAVARSEAPGDPAVTDAMMVSHIRYPNFLQGGANQFTGPISIDAAAFRALMDLPDFAAWRDSHMVMADALGVKAVKQWYRDQEGQAEFPNRTAVSDALLAGNDLLPLIEFYKDPDQSGWRDYQLPLIQDSILFMREQYAQDAEFRRRADDAVRHVIAAKMRLYPTLRREDILVDPAAARAAAGTGRDAMTALSDAALTLIQPSSVAELRGRLPRGPQSPDKTVIVECWADCYSFSQMPRLELQNQMLAAYGPSGKGRIKSGEVSTVSFAELDAWLSDPALPENEAIARAFTDASWIIFALAEYNPVAFPRSAAVKRFLKAAPIDLRNKNLVAIAYNSPYHLDSTEISKLDAYFAVYQKTDYAIATGFRALFGEIDPQGASPVSISGTFYNVGEATRPGQQPIALSVFGFDADDVPNGRAVALVAGPLLDRNGKRVADGTQVSFSLQKGANVPVTARSATIDGLASAQLALDGEGDYTGGASVDGVTAAPLSIRVRGGQAEPTPEPAAVPVSNGHGGGIGVLGIAAIAGGASAAAVLGLGAPGFLLYRRRRTQREQVRAHGEAAVAPPAPEPVVPVPEPRLRVDADTRRVYVRGEEARPALSNEQFRLLSYLYERAGKVVPREELVRHVWPDAHLEGVSEEALDALVRRVRERIVQAGGERNYIVTLRGHGFRLEI